MIEINLIKDRALTKEYRNRVIKIAAACGAGIVILLSVLLAVYINLTVSTEGFEDERMRAESEARQLYNRFAIDDWQRSWEDLYREIRIIGDIFEDRPSYARKLSHLARLIPDNFHIKRITADRGEGVIVLELLTAFGRESEENLRRYREAIRNSGVLPPNIEVTEHGRVEVEGEELFHYTLLMGPEEVFEEETGEGRNG